MRVAAPAPGDSGQVEEPGGDDSGDSPGEPLDFRAIQVDVQPSGTSALVRWTTTVDSRGAVMLDDDTSTAWEDGVSDEHSAEVVGLLWARGRAGAPGRSPADHLAPPRGGRGHRR